jgi:uncharacterized RDD family membrane protein YckC
MQSRFEPDVEGEASALLPAVVTESAASDPQLANLERRPEATPRARFVVEPDATPPSHKAGETGAGDDEGPGIRAHDGVLKTTEQDAPDFTPVQVDLIEQPGGWRQEVAARVDHYRARRRPRGPRYPSLRLKFEPSEPAWVGHSTDQKPMPTRATRQAVALENVPPEQASAELRAAEPTADVVSAVPETAKIIEFPRAVSAPAQPLDELADPVFDRPRILEVPEVAPPPPALGGILIEPAEKAANEKRPGFEIPLQSAPMWRRVLAGGVDGALVLGAFAGFTYVFFKLTGVVPPIQQALSASALLVGVFWAGYQYLMLVHTGTTLGLRAAGLRLSRFDGSPASRPLRRWRVLASVLSAVSLGLGYAWCFLDEDGLCWHDRITHTYMAPRAGVP